ncbi:MAG TPA: hypothetical protein VLT36_02525 [Candidatus Dormibacteraeota bacterium]|nr:hypothetical protein [Candidatus Dormibacteraeota bacterium]
MFTRSAFNGRGTIAFQHLGLPFVGVAARNSGIHYRRPMLMKSRYSKSCAFLALTLTLAAAAPQAFSVSLTVTNLADSGAGTLRDRLAAALPGDTIQIGLSGTITLNSELVLFKSLRINGPTANSLRISGNNHSRVFNITSGSAQIYNLTIADGRIAGTTGPAGLNGENVSGGGIRVANGATLDLGNCILTNNLDLGGQGGPASLSGPAGNGGYGYGGALASFGNLTMVRCTLAGNSASGGAGGPPPAAGSVGKGAVAHCTLKVRRSCFTQRSVLTMRWPVRVLPAPALLVAEAFTPRRHLTSTLAPSSATLRPAVRPTPAAALATTEI